jgi:hypothetical protein
MRLELQSATGDIVEVTTIKDATNPEMDWWDVARDIEQGEVLFDLGQWALDADVAAGEYKARLIVFSPSTSDGLVWLSWIQDDLTVTVLD